VPSLRSSVAKNEIFKDVHNLFLIDCIGFVGKARRREDKSLFNVNNPGTLEPSIKTPPHSNTLTHMPSRA
jgi:hypothetical protein